MGSKGGGYNPKKAIAAMEKYTPTSYGTNIAGFGSSKAVYNPYTKQIESQTTLDPAIQQAITQAQQGLLGYEDRATAEGQRAREIAYQPMQDYAKEQLGSYFNALGASGRRTSQGVTAMSRFAEQQARNQAASLYDIEQKARQGVLGELQGTSQLAYAPAQTVIQAGSGQAAQLGSGLSNLGQGVANQYQMQQQAKMQQQANKGQGISSLISGGIGLASSFAPIPKPM